MGSKDGQADVIFLHSLSTSAGYRYGFSTQENGISADELNVQGYMPEWLRGSLIRTAPSKFEVGNSKYRHWFDGLAMLHKVTIHEGKLTIPVSSWKVSLICKQRKRIK